MILKLGDVGSILRGLSLSIGLFALGSISAAATTLQEQEFTCPIGGQTFKATIVASSTFFGQRLDLKPIAPMPSSLLPVCPANGFVMYKTNFSGEELSKLTPMVLSDEFQLKRAENTSDFMVAYMRERMGADDEEVGLLYLQASWEAETERPLLVSRYRSLALEKLQLALGRDRRWRIVLLAAELERLLGQLDAVEARLAAVPRGALNEGQSMALEQIRKHAQDRNAEPQLPPPNNEGLIDVGVDPALAGEVPLFSKLRSKLAPHRCMVRS